MQFETLEQKTLEDGSTVSLVKRPLAKEIAEAFKLRLDSYELVIGFTAPDGTSSNTWPQASWHLGENVFRKIYEAIENHGHYRNALNVLGHIKDKAHARKLLGMSDIPTSRIIHAPFAKEFVPNYQPSE